MHSFLYKDDELYCEGISIQEIAESVGTPFYLYSHETLLNHYKRFDNAFKEIDHLVCFAVKANSNIAVLKILANEGSGMDIVSGGELFRVLTAGTDPGKIVYAGVGKSDDEIRYALESNILMFNVESKDELLHINNVAKRVGKKASIALRVNPDVDPKTHPYISTGLKKNKFGLDIKNVIEDYRLAHQMEYINVIGIHLHIGSQITETAPFVEAINKVILFLEELKKEGINIKYIDIGGGLGITYNDENPPDPDSFAEDIVPLLKDKGFTVIFEPGRVIAGNAGVLVTRVLYTKTNVNKNFVIVDAGMNDLVRPSLYNSYQAIQPVKKTEAAKLLMDIVGPICETGDFLAKDRVLPSFKSGDLLSIMSSGAYGFTMSSNYNSRKKIPEVLVKGKKYYIIRERESNKDLIVGEHMYEDIFNN